MTILAKNLFLLAKTIFASLVFTWFFHGKNRFFHRLAKTCKPWLYLYNRCGVQWSAWSV